MAELPKVSFEILRLSSAIAEVLVHVDFNEDVVAETRLAGRVAGPHCPGAETIEIAYPIHAVEPNSSRRRSARIVIPEPNLWDAQTPFTYAGAVEVWIEAKKSTELPLEIGLRQAT